jgi:hypothetical protein
MRTLVAIRFDRELKVGRNKPVILTCEDGADSTEVIAKFAHRCERGKNALVAEAISAMFAIDLGLPIPEPIVVTIDPDLVDDLFQNLPGRSAPVKEMPAFGSRILPPGFALVSSRKQLPENLLQQALEILAFDVLIQNSDRIPNNPNCLTADSQLAIIDHELSFLTTGIIGWRPPWEQDSLGYLNAHLFYDALKGWPVDLDRLIGAVEAVTDERMNGYLEALPEEWTGPDSQENEMIELLRSMRAHVADVVIQVKQVLQ